MTLGISPSFNTFSSITCNALDLYRHTFHPHPHSIVRICSTYHTTIASQADATSRMGVRYCALASIMPSRLTVRTATQQRGILSGAVISLRTHPGWETASSLRKVCYVLRLPFLPLPAHLGWDIDSNLHKGCGVLRLQFIQIGLLCLEDVDGLARRGSRRVPILDLTTMHIRARQVDLLDSASLGMCSRPVAPLELTPIQNVQ